MPKFMFMLGYHHLAFNIKPLIISRSGNRSQEHTIIWLESGLSERIRRAFVLILNNLGDNLFRIIPNEFYAFSSHD